MLAIRLLTSTSRGTPQSRLCLLNESSILLKLLHSKLMSRFRWVSGDSARILETGPKMAIRASSRPHPGLRFLALSATTPRCLLLLCWLRLRHRLQSQSHNLLS
ncbi:hypothetical protein M758_3G253900 [Ceratodon purpureus]|nr:hypothetical protein M758_3G253900 [Ceratodon purpureus]